MSTYKLILISKRIVIWLILILSQIMLSLRMRSFTLDLKWQPKRFNLHRCFLNALDLFIMR